MVLPGHVGLTEHCSGAYVAVPSATGKLGRRQKPSLHVELSVEVILASFFWKTTKNSIMSI